MGTHWHWIADIANPVIMAREFSHYLGDGKVPRAHSAQLIRADYIMLEFICGCYGSRACGKVYFWGEWNDRPWVDIDLSELHRLAHGEECCAYTEGETLDPLTALFDRHGPIPYSQLASYPHMSFDEKKITRSVILDRADYAFKQQAYVLNQAINVPWHDLCLMQQKWLSSRYKIYESQDLAAIVALHRKYMETIFSVNKIDSKNLARVIWTAMSGVGKKRCLYFSGAKDTAKTLMAKSLRNFFVHVSKYSHGAVEFSFGEATKSRIFWMPEFDARMLSGTQIALFKELAEGAHPSITPKGEPPSQSLTDLVIADSNYDFDEVLTTWMKRRHEINLDTAIALRSRIYVCHFELPFEFEDPTTVPFNQGFHPFSIREWLMENKGINQHQASTPYLLTKDACFVSSIYK
jgi:hypothetical protein